MSVTERVQLAREIRGSQFFSLGFGSIVGMGWIIFVGEWLSQAGPLGAILAFLAGGMTVVLVGFCYAEMAALLPVSGGEVAYAYEVFGTRAAFVVGWALVLPYILVTTFVAVSVGWVTSILLPGIEGPTLYTILDQDVSLGSLFLGLGGMVFFTVLNYRGLKFAARAQDILTYGLLALSILFILSGIAGGDPSNLEPLFAGGNGSAQMGFLAVMVTVPWWLSGFNVIPQVMEEALPGVSTRTVGKIMIASILLAGVFYCLVMLSSSMAMPWRDLLDLDLPVAGAFEAAFNSVLLARVVLLAGLLGLLTTWNAVFIAASRLLFAMGRGRIIAPVFGKAHPVYLTPAAAILFVGAVGFLGSFLGRNILVPMVNAGGACIALAFFSTCFGVLRLRQRQPEQSRPFPVPGGLVTVALASFFSFAMMVVSVYLPWTGQEGSFPVEWGFLLGWGGLGVLFWYRAGKSRQEISEAERRRLIIGDAALGLDRSPSQD